MKQIEIMMDLIEGSERRKVVAEEQLDKLVTRLEHTPMYTMNERIAKHGMVVVVDGTRYRSAGQAAQAIVDMELLCGVARLKATVSRNIRHGLGTAEEIRVYGYEVKRG